MGTFLIDGGKSYSYSALLQSINEDDYFPLLKTTDLFSYFSNLVKALANNRSLTLLDSDLNLAELKGMDENLVNVKEKVSTINFSSMADVTDAVKNSNSRITIFTSGTTGQPKKIRHDVQTLTRSVRQGGNYTNHIWGYTYNPTHMAGIQVFFQAFMNKNVIVNVFNRPRHEVYEMVDRYSITHLSATPTFYRLLLPVEKTCPTVLRVTLGGEKSDGHLYQAIRAIFPSAKINNVYASTEAGSLFASKGDCFQLPAANRDKFKITDGELLIHRSLLGTSDSLVLDGDFYHSGDLIEWVNQQEGLFRFKGRKNELINVGGYKVNPEEVEMTLNSIEGVRQSIVYGKANSVIGSILCADILLEQNVKMRELDIRQALNGKLQDYKIPRRIRFVESISVTRTGKLKRI